MLRGEEPKVKREEEKNTKKEKNENKSILKFVQRKKMTTSEAPSQPESLDLDYDDWEGQFEFVGSSNNNSAKCVNDDDLNLSVYVPSKQPILFDEETFLSLQPHDFEHDTDELPPISGYFIENALQSTNGDVNADSIKISKDSLNNKFTAAKYNNNLSVEDFNLKNNRICEEFKMKGLKPNHLNNGNANAADLCDNLTEQLEILQRQVTNLADSQSTVDDRTTRTKTEHAVLQARYHMLEEQLRDVELRADERILEEQKRHKELLARVEREAILQNENCQIKIRTIEIEAKGLKEENQRLRDQCTKQAYDIQVLEEKLESVRDNFIASQEEVLQAKHNEKKCMQEKLAAEDLMIELGKEVERLRSENLPALPTTSPEAIRLEELHQEMEDLRHAKKLLEEQNEELHAMVLNKGVEEGRHLLNGTSNSLAFELGEMNNRELQSAYQDKEDENQRLKHYIDTILLNIVENYPQLLEVKAIDSAKQ